MAYPMGVFACLPWYDLAELTDATDALWDRIAFALRRDGVEGVPARLDRGVHYEEQWRSGALLLGQACGYDVAIAHAHRLQLVATPVYAVTGCDGPRYSSFIIVRDDEQATSLAALRGRRCVINTPTSHSGTNILRALVAPLAIEGRFFASVAISGAHEASLELLRSRRADVAAIDCVTYGLLGRVRPALLRGTRVIDRTPSAAAPPYVTGAATDAHTLAALRRALREAIADRAVAAPLALGGLRTLALRDYDPIVEMQRSAHARGYAELLACAAAVAS